MKLDPAAEPDTGAVLLVYMVSAEPPVMFSPLTATSYSN
jgi:hypothetical protein